MFGQIETLRFLVSLTAALAAVSDLWKGRIYNALTVPAAVLGVVVAVYWLGWSGLGQSVLGMLAGLILFGWIFWIRHLGGGDVKLLIALGAMGGAGFALEVAILSVVLGGVFSIGSLVWNGKLLGFLKKLRMFLYSLLVKELEVQIPVSDRNLTIPFGVPMAIGAVWSVYFHPLHESHLISWLGGSLWP